AILCEVPRTATVTAKSPLTTLRIDKDLFFRLINEFPQMAVEIMRELARRLEHTNEQLRAAVTRAGAASGDSRTDPRASRQPPRQLHPPTRGAARLLGLGDRCGGHGARPGGRAWARQRPHLRPSARALGGSAGDLRLRPSGRRTSRLHPRPCAPD